MHQLVKKKLSSLSAILILQRTTFSNFAAHLKLDTVNSRKFKSKGEVLFRNIKISNYRDVDIKIIKP